jgi:hypothetical protein
VSYAACTTDADIAAALFPDDALLEHLNLVIYGSPAQTMKGILRVLSDPDRFTFSGSIKWHGTHVNGQLVVPAGGQLKLPEQRRSSGSEG